MNKKVLAIAIAAIGATPAIAQNVQVYGVIDSGYGQTKTTTATASYSQNVIGGLNSGNGSGTLSGSRLGFRGNEDLGGGARAGFVLEQGMRLTNGTAASTATADNVAAANGALFGNIRQAFVEIGSNTMGSLRIGTFNSQVKDVSEAFDAGGGYALTGAASVYQVAASPLRPSNAIEYKAPEFVKGLELKYAMYKDGAVDSAAAASQNNGTSVSGVYTTGNLAIGGAYENYSNYYLAATGASSSILTVNGSAVYNTLNGSTAVTYDNYVSSVLGVRYTMGDATLFGSFNKLDATDATTTLEGSRTAKTVGVRYNLGSGLKVEGSYSRADVTSAAADYLDLQGQQLVVTKDLSKRTNLYAAMGVTKFDQVNSTTDVRIRQSFVGLRHSF